MSRHHVLGRSRPGKRLLRFASGVALAVTLATPALSNTVAARNETVVREAFHRWKEGSNIFSELLSPEIVWTIHGSSSVAGTYRGIEDFIERAARPLVSRLATPIVPKVHHIWSVGDAVIVRFDGSATTRSGAPYRNQFVWIFRMKDGRVSEAEAFLDLVAYQRVVDGNDPGQPR